MPPTDSFDAISPESGDAAEVVDILLVEDNAGDIMLAREAFAQIRANVRLHVARDGMEAMAYLRRQAPHGNDAPRPGLILLDINLPAMDGREVLAEISADEGLRRIPVVILTTSRGDFDLVEKYGLPAECYLIKPTAFADYELAIRRALELRHVCRG